MADIDKELQVSLEYFEELKNKRSKWDSIWDELAKYVAPQTRSNKEVFDSSSTWSREQLASGLQSLLVNPAMNWFNISSQLVDQDIEAEDMRLWQQLLEQTILNVFNNPASSFYNQIHELFLTLTAYGTAIFYIEEDLSLPHAMLFRNINIRQCYFEEDKSGRISTMYRLFSIPVRLAVNKWPDYRLFQEKLEKAALEEIEILHITEPDEKDSKFTSRYIDLGSRQIIAESAYSYFPFMVCRWIKEEGESYGYAPAHHVLADIKLLNSLRSITLKQAQKQLDPPLLVPKDGYYLPLYTTPGSVNFYRGGVADKIVPLTGMENFIQTEHEQNQCREAIFKAFYIDIFRMQKENKEMTAAEVQVRTEEQMRMMSPMVGRIESEFLNPLIINIYKILAKYNMIPELEGINIDNIKISYVSPLARAQKSSQVNSIESVLGFFQRSGIVNMFPEIYDNIDFDIVLKKFFDLKGAPQEVMRNETEIAQLRRQRQVMQQQAAMQEQYTQTGNL